MRFYCGGCGTTLTRDELGGQGAVDEFPGDPLFHLALAHHPDCYAGSRCVETCPVMEQCGRVLPYDEVFAEWREHGEPVA